MHDYCRLPSTDGMHCSFVVSWLSAYSVMFLMCSCMVFMVDSSGHVMTSVILVIFMLIIMPCSVGYDSLLIWLIVMLYPHAYVDIMLMHCNCIMLFLSWLSLFAFKFNQIKLNLNTCWLSHGATILN